MHFRYSEALYQMMASLIKTSESLFSEWKDPATACEVYMLHCLSSVGAVDVRTGEARRQIFDIAASNCRAGSPAGKKISPKMSSSVALAVNMLCERLGAHETDIAPFSVLLDLVQDGYAKSVFHHGEPVWAPTPALLRQFNWVVSNRGSHPQRWEAGPQESDDALMQRMDTSLQSLFRHHRLTDPGVAAALGLSPPDLHLTIFIQNELCGDAIAYRRSNGQLAWRASDSLKRDLAEEGDDDDDQDFDNDNQDGGCSHDVTD